jgi:hypothetical protein
MVCGRSGPVTDQEDQRTITMTGESVMNTKVIDHLSGAEDFRGLRIKTALRRVSPIRRFRNLIELGDWDETILQHGREIDVFCWLLAGGTAALLIPVGFLLLKG